MSYRLNSSDLRDIRNAVLDNISRSNKGLIGDVGYEMDRNRDIENDVTALVDLLAEDIYISLCEENREDVMNTNRGFDDLVDGLVKIIAHAIGYEINEVYRKMTNKEIDDAKEFIHVIDSMCGGRRNDRRDNRNRGRGSDRDSRRNESRGSSRSYNRRNSGQSRNDRRDSRSYDHRNSDSSRRDSYHNSTNTTSPYSRRVSNNTRNQSSHDDYDDDNREPSPIIELAVKSNSIAEPTEASRVAYDATKLVLMHETIDGVVTETLVEVDTVESYDEHELSQHPFAAEIYDSPNERQSETQYELIPDLSDKDSSDIRVVDAGTTYGMGIAPDIAKIFYKTLPTNNTEVVVTNVAHNVILQYPSTITLNMPNSFEAWHKCMSTAHAAIAKMETIKDITLTQAFLSRLDVMLTDQFNRLLAVCVSVNTSVSSFYRYYNDAKAFIDSPENNLIQSMYKEIERNIINHSFKAVAYKDSNIGNEDLATDDTVNTLVIEMPYTYIKVFGILAQNRVHLANDGGFVRVTHDNTPEFTEVARSAIRRVKGKTNIVISDVFGNNVEVVSAGSAASPIAARLK